MAQPPPEHVTVDGYGVIEIFGDFDASALHLDFAPVVVEGWDMRGSLGRFALRLPKTGHHRPGLDTWLTRDELRRVRRWLARPPRDSRPVRELWPLLRLLASGEYDVWLAQLPHIDNGGIGYAFTGSYHYPHTPEGPRPRRPITRVLTFTDRRAAWYDWDTDTLLLPTDAWPPRDTATVTAYRQAIRDGHRPAVVVLRAGVGYVIDGHHKLAAYLEEEILPWVVNIDARDPRPIRQSPAARHQPR